MFHIYLLSGVQSLVETYGTELKRHFILPKQYPNLPCTGIYLDGAESALSLPLKCDDISFLKTHTNTQTRASHNYWIQNEQLNIKNTYFSSVIVSDIRKDIVRGFCPNFNDEEFEVRLLGMRFCDTSCLESARPMSGNLVLKPKSQEVASASQDFEHFCATIRVQV